MIIALTLLPAVGSLAGTAEQLRKAAHRRATPLSVLTPDGSQLRGFSLRENALVRGANGHVQRKPGPRILKGVTRRGGLIICIGCDDPEWLRNLPAPRRTIIAVTETGQPTAVSFSAKQALSSFLSMHHNKFAIAGFEANASMA